MSINADIQNNYATTTVSQTLKNTGSAEEEMIFYYTIPTTAFLSQFKLEINDTVFVSRVVEKSAAQEEYDSAKDSGKTASMVGSASTSLETFEIKLNIKPDQEVTYHLVYEEYIARFKGNYTYSIPLTKNTYPSEGEFGIYVNLESVAGFTDVKTPDHTGTGIETILDKKGSVTYLPEDRNFIQDFNVVYSIGEYPVNGYMLNYVMGDYGYFFHVFCPGLEDIGGEALGKDIVFVIDKSGSMSGDKMDQTKDAFKSIVDDLQANDQFNIVAFSNEVLTWKSGMVTANTENIEAAKTYIDEVDATGSTNIDSSMTTGLDLLPEESDNVPIICFLTDGQPTAGETNLPTIRENIQTANTMEAAVFCLGFGNDCDFTLLDQIALENDGTATKIDEGSDASDQIVGYYDTFSTPLVSDLTFNYGEDTWDVFPARVPSLFQGSEVAVVGRYDPGALDSLVADIKGDTADGEQDFGDTYELLVKTDQDFIPRYWASQKIRDLTDQTIIDGETEEIKENITNLAVEYQFVTKYTSMILVVEKDPEGSSTNTGDKWDDPERRDDDYVNPDEDYEGPPDAAWDDDDDSWGEEEEEEEEEEDGSVFGLDEDKAGGASVAGISIMVIVGVAGLFLTAVILGIIIVVLYAKKHQTQPPIAQPKTVAPKTEEKKKTDKPKSSEKKKEATTKTSKKKTEKKKKKA
jgi:uncharacterized protein YegL